MAAGHTKEEGKGRKGVKGELRRKRGRERAKNTGREGNACAHAHQLVGALPGGPGHRPLLSRQARAVAQSSRAPFALPPAPARRCRRRGGGGTRRARVTFPLLPSPVLSHSAPARESREARVAGSGAISPVSRWVGLPAGLPPPGSPREARWSPPPGSPDGGEAATAAAE